MKLRFNFLCHRPVPYYAQQCNQLLSHPHVFATGIDGNNYYFEAEGNLAELSQLAEQVGQQWSLSCWLKQSSMVQIDDFSGDTLALSHSPCQSPYCFHCQEHLDDCRYCGSEALSAEEIEHAVEQFMQTGVCQLNIGGTVRRFHKLTELSLSTHKQLLFCRIDALNEALHISNEGIRLLSSLEKPMLQLLAKDSFIERHQLAPVLHRVHLADDRLTLALSQALAAKGIDAVVVEDNQPKLLLSIFDQQPLALSHRQQPKAPSLAKPLWDGAVIGGYSASIDNDQLQVKPAPELDATIADKWAAACALHTAQLTAPQNSVTAVLFLSRQRQSGLLYQDKQGEYQWLVKLPDALPGAGKVLETIAANPDTGARLVERFKQTQPERAKALEEQCSSDMAGGLSSLYALVAWLIQVASPEDDARLAAEKFTALALGFDGKFSPRIDFKLKREQEVLTLQVAKALQACLSYSLADEQSAQGVCYGVVDSLADFIANWVEQLDDDIGIDQLALAGDEFHSPILLDRIHRRLGNNFTLLLPQETDFEGNNLAMGGLFLQQRRRA